MDTVTDVQGRREFLAQAAGLAAGTCAVAAAGASTALAAPARRHYGMVIDLQRCVACRSCTIACKQENLTPPGVFYNWYILEETGEYPKPQRTYHSRPCMHCEKPACLPVCPVDPDAKGHRATWKRENDGIVVVDYDRCIGCGQCAEACPFGARYLDEKGDYVPKDNPLMQMASPEYGRGHKRAAGGPPIEKARKCTFCLHRQDAEGNYQALPACALTCMGKAIKFGDLNDPASEVAQLLKERKSKRLRADKGTEPSVYYLV